MATKQEWPNRVHRVFGDMAIRRVSYVPDVGLTKLLRLCHADRKMKTVVLTTEEEGVAMAAGAWLAGERAALLMQSSGVGNCINMLALAQNYRFPLLMLVMMRGQWGEINPGQVPMGQGTARALESVGVVVQTVDDPGAVEENVRKGAEFAFNTNTATALLITQRVVGAKKWSKR